MDEGNEVDVETVVPALKVNRVQQRSPLPSEHDRLGGTQLITHESQRREMTLGVEATNLQVYERPDNESKEYSADRVARKCGTANLPHGNIFCRVAIVLQGMGGGAVPRAILRTYIEGAQRYIRSRARR